MKKRFFDLRLITGLHTCPCSYVFHFHDRAIFWYIFTGSLLILITFAMFQEDVEDESSFFTYISIGALSGILLYFFFGWVSKSLKC